MWKDKTGHVATAGSVHSTSKFRDHFSKKRDYIQNTEMVLFINMVDTTADASTGFALMGHSKTLHGSPTVGRKDRRTCPEFYTLASLRSLWNGGIVTEQKVLVRKRKRCTPSLLLLFLQNSLSHQECGSHHGSSLESTGRKFCV